MSRAVRLVHCGINLNSRDDSLSGSTMHAIASLLDHEHTQRVNHLLREFSQDCGTSTAVRIAPIPHFSWQGAESYDLDELYEKLSDISSSIKPFTVRTSGLGFFTGAKLILYLAMVKNEQMFSIHHQIWQGVKNIADELNLYYAPEFWIPHITLAYDIQTGDQINCLFRRLAVDPLSWDLPIDNIAVIEGTVETPGEVLKHFDLTG